MPSKSELQEQTGKILGFVYVSHIYDVQHSKVRDDPWLKQALTIRSKAASGASDDSDKSGVYAWVINKAVPLRETVSMPRGQLRVWWVSASLSQQLKRSLQSALTPAAPASDQHAEQCRIQPSGAATNQSTPAQHAVDRPLASFSPPGAAIMQSSAVLQPVPLVPVAGSAVPAAGQAAPPQLPAGSALRAHFNLADAAQPASAPTRQGSIFGLLAQALNGRPPPVQGWSSPPADHHVFVVTPGASQGAPSSIASYSRGPRSGATAGVPDVTVLVADNSVELGRDPAGSPPLLHVDASAANDDEEDGCTANGIQIAPQLASGAAVQLPAPQGTAPNGQLAGGERWPQPATRLLQSAPRDQFGSNSSSNAAEQPTREQQDRSDFSLLQGAMQQAAQSQWTGATKRPREGEMEPLRVDADDPRFKVPRAASDSSPSGEGSRGDASCNGNSAGDPTGSQYTAGSSRHSTAERRACSQYSIGQGSGGDCDEHGGQERSDAADSLAGMAQQHANRKTETPVKTGGSTQSAYDMSRQRQQQQQSIAEL